MTSPSDADEPIATPPQVEPAPKAAVIPPDHRDMYLLVIGLAVGLMLSPWLLGRFLDEPTYNRWYYGGGEALDNYETFLQTHEKERREKQDELLERLKSVGATMEAVEEMQAAFEAEGRAERKPYADAIQAERTRHEQWYRGLMLAMVVTGIMLMFLEPLFDLPGPFAPLRRRVVTGRYVLAAIWLGLALAKPHVLTGTPWVFVLLLIAVAVLAAVAAQVFAGRRPQ